MLGADEKKKLEAEHGPVVVISHPGDGSCFAFKRMTREQYDLREKRITRNPPDIEADDKLLQERCVYPSREAWNAYAAQAAFEVEAYIGAYRQCHGQTYVRKADEDEIPEGCNGDLVLTNGHVVFAFRKPTRVDIKRLRSDTLANDPKRVENLLNACALSPDFRNWLEANLFGVGAFGDALTSAFGMADLRGDAVK